MAQRMTTVRFVCSICERKHTRKEATEKCERKGISIPPFNQCDVVEYIGKGNKHKPTKGQKMIVLANGHRVYLKPTYAHKLPSLYAVWYRDNIGLWSAGVEYYSLKKVIDFNGEACPLCGSTEVFDSTRDNYQVFTSLFPKKLPQLGAVACKDCPNCKKKFFTSEQSAEVERRIKRGIESQ